MQAGKKNIVKYLLKIISVYILFFIASCHKPAPKPITNQTGTVSDAEGNIYKTVLIGNQWWMAENLKSTKYRDGSYLLKVSSVQNTTWDTLKTGGWCLYDDNTASSGYLYNWYAVNDAREIAPAGWHIPSDEEWKQLEENLGMSSSDANKTGWRGTHEGEKLKIESKKNWTPYGNVWDTNESGFTALAGSCRIYNGTWGDPGLGATGFWWTSAQYDSDKAWYRYLDYKNANVFRSHVEKNYGFSIRCVKD